MKLVLGITTYNRREYLEECLRSWYNTITLDNWNIIISDDGSTDGTLDFLHDIEFIFPLYIFKMHRKGVHVGTNNILHRANELGFEYGFKLDDDIILKKRGWDTAYIEAIKESGFDHLCHYDNGNRPPKVYLNGLQSSTSIPKTQGALWTFTPRILRDVGYFDVSNFGFCGYGHVDYTARCCRAGYNEACNVWDIRGSNSYASWRRPGYHAAITYGYRMGHNSKAIVSKKMKLIRDDSRVYIDDKLCNSN